MRVIIGLSAALALAGCDQAKETTPAANNEAEVTNTDATAVPAALTTLNETTWEYIDPDSGKPIRESIDANGNYISVSGSEHIDHGTAVMKDGKACFTSAMNKEGEVCWTDPMLAVGQSGETTSDKGEKLTVKRVTYVPLTM
ncbi:MAG TPA: hypothetical protein VFO51_04220 [Sphingomicrobium sp.]|nr:hypothetical protein [Sphingomicrobium sp.]